MPPATRPVTQLRSFLCVGGALSGQRKAVHHGTGFSVLQFSGASLDKPDREGTPAPLVQADYRLEHFNTPEGVVNFWVPAEQTPLQTINLLLKTYEDSGGNQPVAPPVVECKTADEIAALCAELERVTTASHALGVASPIVQNAIDHLSAVARVHRANKELSDRESKA